MIRWAASATKRVSKTRHLEVGSRPTPILPIPNTRPRHRADNPFMRSGRWSRRVAPLGLALALWAALPSLEWCPLSWQECHELLGVSAAQAKPGMVCEETPGRPTGLQEACDGCPSAPRATSRATKEPAPTATASTASTASAKSARRSAGKLSLPCDPDPDPTPLGDRSYCLHPPNEVVAPRIVDVVAPKIATPHAAPVKATVVPPPAVRAVARTRKQAPSPSVALPHAPPQSRAPPVGVPSNLF